MVAGPTQGDPIDAAIRSGAKAVIFVAAPERGLIRPSYIAFFEKDTLPVITVSEAVADELIASSGKHIADLRKTLEERRRRSEQRPSLVRSVPEPLSFDTPTRIRIDVSLASPEPVRTMNVVGMLRGSDPDRAKKFVIVGGHLDGVGTDPDGTVFTAANDNASGPAVTIEVARALAAKRAELKRSIVFVAWAGEEEGLLGSEAYAARMASSPGRVESLVAYLNLDVIGCCGNTLEASDESSALVDRIRAAARTLGVPFQSIRGGGSDQATFAKRGVPSSLILWSDIILHTPRDTIALIETPRLQKAGDVVTAVTYELGRGEGP